MPCCHLLRQTLTLPLLPLLLLLLLLLSDAQAHLPAHQQWNLEQRPLGG
jgi:hypothetical protein